MALKTDVHQVDDKALDAATRNSKDAWAMEMVNMVRQEVLEEMRGLYT